MNWVFTNLGNGVSKGGVPFKGTRTSVAASLPGLSSVYIDLARTESINVDTRGH